MHRPTTVFVGMIIINPSFFDFYWSSAPKVEKLFSYSTEHEVLTAH